MFVVWQYKGKKQHLQRAFPLPGTFFIIQLASKLWIKLYSYHYMQLSI